MNEEFQIKENGFNEIKKALIIKIMPIVILAIVVGLMIGYYNTNAQSSGINVLPFVIPLIIGVVAFGLNKGINRQKEIFESFKIIINENEIIRVQNDTQTISIPYNDVKSINRNSDGKLTIFGNSTTDIIGVPSQINNLDRLEQLLTKIKPITVLDKKTLMEKYKILLVIIMFGSMACVYIIKDKWIVGITGTVLIVFLGYSLYQAIRNKSIDKKTKNSLWWIIIVLLSIIGSMYFKLTGKI